MSLGSDRMVPRVEALAGRSPAVASHRRSMFVGRLPASAEVWLRGGPARIGRAEMMTEPPPCGS
jgi:hypothetical protein